MVFLFFRRLHFPPRASCFAGQAARLGSEFGLDHWIIVLVDFPVRLLVTLDRFSLSHVDQRSHMFQSKVSPVRSEVNSELNFPPNFEGLVLGCIDADFCK